MNSLMTWISKIQIKKVVTVCFVGLFIFVTQACSSVSAQAPDLNGRERYKDVRSDRVYEGGMNGYSDTNSNGMEQPLSNLEESADKFIDKADNVARDVKRSVSSTADKAADKIASKTDDLTSNLQEGFENVKDNVSNVPKYLSKTADRTAANPIDNLKEEANYISSKADEVGSNLQNVGSRLQSKASRKVDRDINATQRQLEKVGNAIEDAID